MITLLDIKQANEEYRKYIYLHSRAKRAEANIRKRGSIISFYGPRYARWFQCKNRSEEAVKNWYTKSIQAQGKIFSLINRIDLENI